MPPLSLAGLPEVHQHPRCPKHPPPSPFKFKLRMDGISTGRGKLGCWCKYSEVMQRNLTTCAFQVVSTTSPIMQGQWCRFLPSGGYRNNCLTSPYLHWKQVGEVFIYDDNVLMLTRILGPHSDQIDRGKSHHDSKWRKSGRISHFRVDYHI